MHLPSCQIPAACPYMETREGEQVLVNRPRNYSDLCLKKADGEHKEAKKYNLLQLCLFLRSKHKGKKAAQRPAASPDHLQPTRGGKTKERKRRHHRIETFQVNSQTANVEPQRLLMPPLFLGGGGVMLVLLHVFDR